MMRKTASVFLCGLSAATAAWADDSTAQLKAGGIVLTQGTPVKMAEEDLYISPKEVRIRFAFTNPTTKDIESLVAFPLPDLDMAEFWGSGAGIVTTDARNFIGFKAVVDGRPVAFRWARSRSTSACGQKPSLAESWKASAMPIATPSPWSRRSENPVAVSKA